MNIDKLIVLAERYLKLTAKKKPWSKKPKGWKDKSIKKYYKTMSEDSKHPFTTCVEKMKKHIDNPEAYCASIRDIAEETTHWRKPWKKSKKK